MKLETRRKEKGCTDRKAERGEDARSRRRRERNKAAMVDRRIERGVGNEVGFLVWWMCMYILGFRVLVVTPKEKAMSGPNAGIVFYSCSSRYQKTH